MTRKNLGQKIEIVYFKNMSKFVQFRRNMLKNQISAAEARIFPAHIFAKEVIA